MSTLRRCLRSFAAITFFSLALVRPAAAIDWTDIWWNPAESGWGVNFIKSDNFIFATFFIYGTNLQPTWVTAQLTEDINGVWSGPLYFTTGPYYGGVWDPSQRTTNQVGTATFTPSTSTDGTLTYNVANVTVTKQITRQTLKLIPAGGLYSGALLSIFRDCTNPADNGPITYFANLTVDQTAAGALQFNWTAFTETSSFSFVIAGGYVQQGLLYRVPNATYASSPYTFTAQVSEVKVTAQGIEGRWTAPVGAFLPGCVEDAYFSQLFIAP